MTARTLPREPWRGSMICGFQTCFGGWSRPMAWCAERKADGIAMCQEHYDETLANYGYVHMAPGNALGAAELTVRLLWEPEDGGDPTEASADEVLFFASMLDLPKNVF